MLLVLAMLATSCGSSSVADFVKPTVPATPRADDCDARIASTEGLGLAASTGLRLDGGLSASKTTLLVGNGKVSMWLKVDNQLLEADLSLDGCPTTRTAIVTRAPLTSERIGAWDYRVQRSTSGAITHALLTVPGGVVLLYPLGVSPARFESVLAELRVLTGDEWRTYRDALPRGTIS